jgi:hypothetical protein
MTGWNTIVRIRRIEEEVNKLGFKFENRKNSDWVDDNQLALVPIDEQALPVYNRNAEVFTGSLEELVFWLRGVAWARDYDKMLKVSDEKRRAVKEQDFRERMLVKILKDEKVELK